MIVTAIMQSSAIFYMLIAAITGLLVALSQKVLSNRKGRLLGSFLMILSFLIPFIIASVRYGIGTDYFNYVNIYNGLFVNPIWENLKQVEPGFILISYIAKFVFNDVQYVFVIFAFLTLLFVYLAVLQTFKGPGRGVAIFLYICISYLAMLCIIRQALACAIVLYAFRYMEEKNFKKYFLFIIIASMFHYTAIIALPFFFLGTKSLSFNQIKSKSRRTVLLVLLVIGIFSFEPIMLFLLSNISFFSKYTVYFLDSEQVGSIYNTIDKLPFILFLLILGRRLVVVIPKAKKYIWMFLIGVLMESASPQIARLINYFSQSLILLLPMFPYAFKNKLFSIIVKILVILYGFLYFYFFYMYGPGKTMGAIPYKTLWGWQP